MTTKLHEKMQRNFVCEMCNFYTSNKYNFNKHLLTSKHKNTIKYNIYTTENAKLIEPCIKYNCECGKSYPYRSSLYNHKKKCKKKCIEVSNEIEDKDNKNKNKNNIINKDLILKLVDENSEIKLLLFKQFETMQNQISELIPKVGNNNTINNKQKFNINIFLNEQCKDALTIDQFVNKIQVTLEDLLVTKNKGITEGVSNIFIENMNKLSLYERPMHCTDTKRETVYIKSGEFRWQH